MKFIFLFLLLSANLYNFDLTAHTLKLSTIYSPIPLIDGNLDAKNVQFYNYINTLSIPLTACIYSILNPYHAIDTIQKNQLISSFMIYYMIHSANHCYILHKKKMIKNEIRVYVKKLFHLLIVMHGINNQINALEYALYKNTTMHSNHTPQNVMTMLEKLDSQWIILLAHYRKQYPLDSLYAYPIDQISIFEIAQATTFSVNILNTLTESYKNKHDVDYNLIINYAKTELEKIDIIMHNIT